MAYVLTALLAGNFTRLVLGEAVPNLLADRERLFWRSLGEG